MNRKPILIAMAIGVVFVAGVLYALMQRSRPVILSEEPERIFDIASTAGQSIEFLEDKPDGLVGVNRHDIGDAPESGYQSRMADRMAQMLEEQALAKAQREAELRERMRNRQLEQYERAIASSSKVEGLGNDAPGADRRARERLPDTIIPASASASASASAPAPAPGRPASTAPDGSTMAALLQALNASGAAAGGGSGAQGVSANPADLQALIDSPQGQALTARVGLAPRQPDERPAVDPAVAARVAAFVGAPSGAEPFVLEERVKTPRSAFELKTGALIAGAMISAANSDLPGDIVAQVTRHVYDTASGLYLLIPQGTKLFGRYDAFVSLGQERLLIVWNRLVFPDATTLDIGGMQGYDARGLAGFRDQVNTHFLRTLGNALLISVVNAAGEGLIDRVTEGGDSVFTVNLAQEFADTTSGAFNEYLRNRLRIKPTLGIRSGYRFNIVVSRDIDFPGPYERGFDAYRAAR